MNKVRFCYRCLVASIWSEKRDHKNRVTRLRLRMPRFDTWWEAMKSQIPAYCWCLLALAQLIC